MSRQAKLPAQKYSKNRSGGCSLRKIQPQTFDKVVENMLQFRFKHLTGNKLSLFILFFLA
jgi:hypothetical protein